MLLMLAVATLSPAAVTSSSTPAVRQQSPTPTVRERSSLNQIERKRDPRQEPAPPKTTTALGGVIHFPAKLGTSDWPAAIAALDRLRLTLGEHAYVRWDMLWHEANWEPQRPSGYERIRYIVGLLAARNLRSLVTIIPHPWPGSAWDIGTSTRDWGAPRREWFPLIALRYRESILAYRDALRAHGMPETLNAVQWGNEPASGHPGGDGTLPRGTWSGHALWKELSRDPGYYGNLQVISPALSMLDQDGSAAVEIATSAIPANADWTERVDGRAMHFRYFQPRATSTDAYVQGYVSELKRRSAFVLAMPWPTGATEREGSRRNGLWVTEAYIAEGDSPEPRAASWRQLLATVKQGIPGVRVFFAYRFHPEGGPDGLNWQIPIDAQVPVGVPTLRP